MSAKQYRTEAHTDEEIRVAVEELLAKMTLKEKLGQMTQSPGLNVSAIGAEVKGNSLYDLIRNGDIGSQILIHPVNHMIENAKLHQKIAVEESRLGIPLIFCMDVIHGYQTIFPIPLAWSCSWNPEQIKKAQQIAAKEAATVGISLAFSPMVDIAHDARWGRVAESAGEDPFLGSAIARAHVEGLQGNSLADPDTVCACVKHYLGYAAAEAGRDYNTCEFSETALRNTYLPPFKAAIDAGCGSLMTAFNTINGVPAVGNKWLCKTLLRDELKYDGVVISDYAAVDELIVHGNAEDGKEAAKLSVDATLDIEMSTVNILNNGEQLLKEGEITLDQIDDAVRRILTYKYKIGLMENPYIYMKEDKLKETIQCQAHLDASRDLARRSIVLLKNEENALPLKKSQKVAVIGPFGESKDLLGTWQFSDFKDVPTIVDGLKAKGIEVISEKGCAIHEKIENGFESALEAAKQADVIILALGESSDMNGEAACRLDISVPAVQFELSQLIVKEVRKPVILVLTNGRPLLLKWYQENVTAIVEAWNLGSMTGHAVADVLVGDYNPSGKLTLTFPQFLGQVPLYYNHYNTGRPCIDHDPQKFVSKYLDGWNDPLYTFGYGLSYTKFEFKNLKLSQDKINFHETLKVSVDVQNVGDVAGEETVQLYIHDVTGSIVRPVKELKGFKKIVLEPTASTTVEFEINEKLLRFYNITNQLVAEPGKFEVFVGNSSDDKDLLKSEFRLTK
ncbi:hypothetical protein TRFO_28100 [Tritrichomonas foetus]|uniref:beta-glucosidase n=1 Tax=Tritrichomonas foetus TaxID=1144522 RepID=A0A1J4K0C2_9EUKA|nr:hypothetical protein TRFO_28100 [Tritrichomonas foetus]|eukprot:OHT04394.1 hypothetical protein TRFO_28100 [Tritrichomonas foetus]